MNDGLPSPPMSVQQVADYLGVSTRVVYRLIRSGQVRAFKVGGRWRISKDAVRQFIEEQIQV